MQFETETAAHKSTPRWHGAGPGSAGARRAHGAAAGPVAMPLLPRDLQLLRQQLPAGAQLPGADWLAVERGRAPGLPLGA